MIENKKNRKNSARRHVSFRASSDNPQEQASDQQKRSPSGKSRRVHGSLRNSPASSTLKLSNSQRSKKRMETNSSSKSTKLNYDSARSKLTTIQKIEYDYQLLDKKQKQDKAPKRHSLVKISSNSLMAAVDGQL